MNVALWKKLLVAAVVVPVVGMLMIGVPLSIGQERSAAKKTETTQRAETPKKAKGRLPAYYADVVSEEQRDKIYAIQAKFEGKIKELQDQLAAIEKEQDAEIEKLLTAEQKAKIEAARKESADKKKKKGDAKKTRTDPAAPPTSDAKSK